VKIAVIGGGPGGLFFSILMKRADPSHDVTVFERNAPDATFGFGVVFPERSMRYLREADQATHAAFSAAVVQWDPIEYRHRGRVLRCRGHVFSGVARADLLAILQRQASGQDVDLRFQHEIGSLTELLGYDLIVAADGVNSLTRREREDDFRPSVHIGRSKYIWLGTTQAFSALTFIFEESEHGWFGVHIYPYARAASTFIVETDDETWRRAGFGRTSETVRSPGDNDQATLEYCERLFARHLDGHRLQANSSRWLNFRTVRNGRWHAGNVVLLGDAAHTAHFSVGSGTRMALEDAVALASALQRQRDVAGALAAYERERRPAVAYIQRAAEPSRRWWEGFRHWTHFEPEQFAFHHLARTRVLTYGTLTVRDAAFVRAAEAWFATDPCTTGVGRASRTAPPALTPFRVRGLEVANRIVAMAEQRVPGKRGRQPQPLAARPDHRLESAGLVLVAASSLNDSPPGATRIDSLREVIQNVRASNAARIGLRLHLDSSCADPATGFSNTLVRWGRLGVEAGIDVLTLDFTPGSPADKNAMDKDATLFLVDAGRAAWPDERPLSAILGAWERPDDDRAGEEGIRLAGAVHARGCDLVGVAFPEQLASDPERAREAHAHTSDLIKNVAGVPTLMVGGAYTVGDVNALILAGRADLCEWPRLAWPGWRPIRGT